jgi:hypothetical protein
MNRLLILIVILPLYVFGQSSPVATKKDLTKAYTQAIADFIKAANKKNKIKFDTLFFGKRVNGQADDFPDIELPATIENTQIRIITPEAGVKKQNKNRLSTYINLIAWVYPQTAEFIFVVFSNGFTHQCDYTLKYDYNSAHKQRELVKLEFESPPFGK